MLRKVEPTGDQFLVYEDLNSSKRLIVRETDSVMGTMRRIYGPSSYEACERFIQGIAYKPNN
jgi:hypothetical protein